ncbi:probable proline--tRNA ligase, mitochondrial [Schistocerca gregaria]|uniref:probable proline--tRNA ligase, mitochondrial n=1 Tax=Schistocerca gregaria TaxID=7010 RepID=UPI00211E4F44|nr:probable proline--tRNA ligase, mitochondrial [Schistocerca gregaria]
MRRWRGMGARRRYSQLGGGKEADVLRRSEWYIPVRWEKPSAAQVASHRLLSQAGYIKKQSAGVYAYLPLGQRTLEKVIGVIDREMKKIGGLKVSMPKMQAKSLWMKTNRWADMGNELVRVVDRRGDEYCMAPTSEEAVTWTLSTDLSSARQLPMKLYQIGDKYRDEVRPRFGLLRAKEFLMKDMYSFDVDADAAMKAYWCIMRGYEEVMRKFEVPYVISDADSGNIGGNLSHEVHILSDIGEDTLLKCGCGNYYANVEKAIGRKKVRGGAIKANRAEEYQGLIEWEQMLDYLLKKRVEWGLKLTLFESDGRMVMTLTDGIVNEYSVRAIASLGRGTTSTEEIGRDQLERLRLLAFEDRAMLIDTELVEEGNSDGFLSHLKSFFFEFRTVRIRLAEQGDRCPGPSVVSGCTDDGVLKACKGIETGHLFYLGTKYSARFQLTVNSGGGRVPVCMGCYGIGVSRMVAAIAEVHHDDFGLRWPNAVAPFLVVVVSVPGFEKDALEVYRLLNAIDCLSGEVILDDRESEGLGYKLREARLIGVPYHCIVGGCIRQGQVQLESRVSGARDQVSVARIREYFVDRIA